MSQNFAKCGRQHVRDVNLWLQEVNVEIAVLAHEPEDDATLIRSAQQTIAWSNFRDQFVEEMLDDYLAAHGELDIEYKTSDLVDS
jgi:hypothetical protein